MWVMDSFKNVGEKELLSGFNMNSQDRSNSDMVKSAFGTFNKIFKELGNSYLQLFRETGILIKKNFYRVIRSILIGVGAFALCCGLAAGVLFIMGTYNKYIFTTENWSTYKSDRINMVDNMESKYTIKGMSQVEVEKLLGKPSYETPKEQCEYMALSKCDYDTVVEYELNRKSRSITDVIAKNYVVAYKDGKAVYADVLIADRIRK